MSKRATGALALTLLTGGPALTGCSAHAAPKPAPTQPFIAFNTCLVTDPAGLTPGTPGARAWAGAQAATAPLHARASYVTATSAQAAGAIGGLILKNCTLIVAASSDGQFAPTVEAAAKAHPEQHFLLVGPATTTANVRSLPPGDDLQERVRQAVTDSAQAH
ncbi:type 1 periplasmic-binding domain-containing protein [Kitasatospora azatica]|uniref:hypothetical protein n=1 Tax=Kitasatospora azatica TaxID=58347 RepID=UPI00056A89C0|nr:hypothetical protein [Kitasatospora azatica]